MKNQVVRKIDYGIFKKKILGERFLLPIMAAIFIFAASCEKSETEGIPGTVTKEVVDIIDTEALGGGTITTSGGTKIVAMGLCYTANEETPTVEGNYVAAGTYTHNGIEETEWDFQVPITGLTPLTTYKVRAYAANEGGVAYGETITFTTKAGKTFHTLTPDMIYTFTQEVYEGAKENLIDGNTGTFWHSAWSGAEGAEVHPLPHYIQITFNEPKAIGGIQYWHRSPSGSAGRPNSFDLQTSEDGESWTTVWESEKNLPVDVLPPAGNTLSLDKNYTSKFFRIRILTNPGSTTFTYLSELKVFHDGLLD